MLGMTSSVASGSRAASLCWSASMAISSFSPAINSTDGQFAGHLGDIAANRGFEGLQQAVPVRESGEVGTVLGVHELRKILVPGLAMVTLITIAWLRRRASPSRWGRRAAAS